MAASMGGLDALVFTAGVGENSSEVRMAACANLRFLGIMLDEMRNAHVEPDQDIATSDSSVRVLVIRTQEDWAIARECWRVMHSPAQPRSQNRARRLRRPLWIGWCTKVASLPSGLDS